MIEVWALTLDMSKFNDCTCCSVVSGKIVLIPVSNRLATALKGFIINLHYVCVITYMYGSLKVNTSSADLIVLAFSFWETFRLLNL